MKYNDRLYAPQFGIMKPIEKMTPVVNTEKSSPDAETQNTQKDRGSVFWYPRDLNMPEQAIPEKSFQDETRRERREPAKDVPVTIRKKRRIER